MTTTTDPSPFIEAQGEPSIALYVFPTSLICLLVACYLAVSLCTVIGNAMVIYIVAKSQRMRNVTNYFVANLAASDLMTGALAIPFQFQAALLQKWVLPYFMCSFCPMVQVISLNVSIFTLVVIALDRYRAVIYPLHAKTSHLMGKVTIASIWSLSILLALPTYVGFKVTFVLDSDTGNYTKPLCDVIGLNHDTWRIYSHVLVVVQYLIPLCIICYAYTFICYSLCREPIVLTNSGTNLIKIRKNKRKVVKMLFIVIALFTICWFPFQMYNLLQEIFPSINEYKYINIAGFSFHLLAMSNSCYNPFIYFIYSERFNCEFKRHFAFCFCGLCDADVPGPVHSKLSTMASSRFELSRSLELKKGRSAFLTTTDTSTETPTAATTGKTPDRLQTLRIITFSGTTLLKVKVSPKVRLLVPMRFEMMTINEKCSRAQDDEEVQL